MALIQLPDGNSAEPCKICGTASPLFDVVDFNKSCQEAQNQFIARSGIPIYYNLCPECGFLFTTAFDSWSNIEISKNIYNSNYALVDPDFSEVRPVANASLVKKMLGSGYESISILDFGGGSGRFRDAMKDGGFKNTNSYDPYHADHKLPQETYDLITAFEVMEHAVRPIETLRTITRLLKPRGVVLFSTLLQPSDIHSIRLNWWYVAPRNGHISLFSAPALKYAWQQVQCNVKNARGHTMMAWRELPIFAENWGKR
jgi:SAM-dependent methyltransferase